MSTLHYVDHRQDPGAWAEGLGVSVEACELLLDAHLIDLHVDMMVPIRVLGYDPSRRHGPWERVMPLMGHTDFPRLREGSFTGICYDIATNPFRPERNRFHATLRNVERCLADIGRHPDELAVVRTRAEYDAAVGQGRTAFFLTLQGGNALAHDPSVLTGPLGAQIHRITLVHLSTSVLGGSSSPSQPDEGITSR
ncbi:MAG: membrane dipeptidase, partial [Myxococcales bacterium]|nr:membrane dipeptidase [Myxococcales bacterium]